MKLPLSCPKCQSPLVYRKKRLKCRKCGFRARAKEATFEIPLAELGIVKKSD